MDTSAIIWKYVIPIIGAYLIAWVVHRLAGRFSDRIIGLSGYAPQGMRVPQERKNTLRELFESAISFIAFLIATIVTLGLFIDTTTLVWTMGLFSAAFGLGARPIISDYLTGISFIFGNMFDIGDKVEILGVEGHIERISLNMVSVRSTQGELFVVPNGEVRVVRNFSRGSFSSADVTIKVDSADLAKTMDILNRFTEEASEIFPEIVRPLQVISPHGMMGQQIELMILAKVQFGKATGMRLKLLDAIYKRLADAEIELAS